MQTVRVPMSSSTKVARPQVITKVAPLQKAPQVVGIAISSLALSFAAHAGGLGEDVFNQNCAACHAGGKNSVIPEKTLNKVALEQYLAGGFKVESIVNQVTNGKGAMPAWGNILDDEEIEAVANYVFDNANTGKW